MLSKSQNKLTVNQKRKLQEMVTNAKQNSLVKNKANKKSFITAALGVLILIASSILVYYVARNYYYRKIYPQVALERRIEVVSPYLERLVNIDSDLDDLKNLESDLKNVDKEIADSDYLTKGAVEDIAAGKALTVAIIYCLFAPIIVIPIVWLLSKRNRNSVGTSRSEQSREKKQ